MIEINLLKGKRSDFLIKDYMGLTHPNPAALETLTAEQFKNWYTEQMKQYDCWKEGKPPLCGECFEQIGSPEQMRRYNGRTLHPDCFKEVYGKQREGESEHSRRYLDLVARIE